jgi:hypothetical protein
MLIDDLITNSFCSNWRNFFSPTLKPETPTAVGKRHRLPQPM